MLKDVFMRIISSLESLLVLKDCSRLAVWKSRPSTPVRRHGQLRYALRQVPGSQSCARGASNISQHGNASRRAPRCGLNFTVKDLSD
jgi:hypothetical protein